MFTQGFIDEEEIVTGPIKHTKINRLILRWNPNR